MFTNVDMELYKSKKVYQPSKASDSNDDQNDDELFNNQKAFRDKMDKL